jgi:hypothetical protein
MNDTFNMRDPEEGEVQSIHQQAKLLRANKIKYRMLKDLLDGKTVDMTQNAQLFEALNRERMEFEEILKLHPDQANEAILATKEDREDVTENIYWNRNSPAKWAKLGHIPPCVYYSRPSEYWNDEKILKAFFNTFTKFRISTREL